MRAAVLQATVDTLLDHGYDALSIGEIARRAGVHETSIYRRWGNKASLALDAVLSRSFAEIPAPDTGSLRGDLLALLRGIVAFNGSPLGELLVRMALTRGAPKYEAARQQFWAERLAVASLVLDRAEARGELRPGVDRLLTFEALIGPLHVRRLLTRQPLHDRFADDVVDLLLAGIAAQRPPPQK